MGGLVWIASYPKSGNTWTRSFLHHLLAEEDEDLDINAMHQVTTWDSAALWYRPLLPRPLDACIKHEVAAVRPQANQRIAYEVDDLIFVKTHNAMVADRGTPMINPAVTAGAIYVVRNPLDVAVSYSHHLDRSIGATINYMNRRGVQTHNSEHMAYEVQSSWCEHVWTWTRKPNSSLLIMRYEDMLSRPLETFSNLIQFLRLRVSMRRLEQALEGTAFNKLKEQEQNKGFREKPKTASEFFREGRSGQWRQVLSPEQIDAIVAANREQMARFGYLEEL